MEDVSKAHIIASINFIGKHQKRHQLPWLIFLEKRSFETVAKAIPQDPSNSKTRPSGSIKYVMEAKTVLVRTGSNNSLDSFQAT